MKALALLDEVESHTQIYLALSASRANGWSENSNSDRSPCPGSPSSNTSLPLLKNSHLATSVWSGVCRMAAGYPVIPEERLDPITEDLECLIGRLSFIMPHR